MVQKRKGSKRKGKVDWEAQAEQLRGQLEHTWDESAKALEKLWHQSAVAALHWVGSHRGRVAEFRRSVKGTPVEGVVDAALRAIRAEGGTTRRAARKPAARRRGRKAGDA